MIVVVLLVDATNIADLLADNLESSRVQRRKIVRIRRAEDGQ
jgi:hypothetical protein